MDDTLLFDIFERILRLNIGVSQAANAEAFDLMSRIVPLTIHRYESGREHNGWVIPHDWVVTRALIKRGGEVYFDGCCHPMAVAGYSSPFRGTVSKQELDQHVFFNRNRPDAFVFHCVYNYRPWQQHWGFCVPYARYRDWPDGEYEVELDTEFKQGDMLVGECHLAGELPDTVVFNAHTCHPCQANDDMVGVMVILELFRWLRTLPSRRYSYRAVLAPEHLGTVFYVADLPDADLANLKLGCFVEMVGTETALVLQRSFTGTTVIDRVAEHVLGQVQPNLKVGDFRTVVGNDETVWEAAGIEIPMISISRWPYPQYHTSEDNLSIMSPARMRETLEALKRIVLIFERDCVVQRQFKGLVALSNPKFDLYVERPDPVVHKQLGPLDLRLGEVQDNLPRYFDGRHTVFQIAEKFGLPFDALHAYISRFHDKGLVTLIPPSSFDQYRARA